MLLARIFVIQAFRIPSESMRDTLLVGDFLFITKLDYGAKLPFTHLRLPGLRQPRRGDIIVFQWPPDPTQDFKVIMNELETWGTGLEQKPMIVVASKIDSANSEKLARLKRFCSRRKLPLMAISAVSGEGIQKLKYAVGERVKEIRATPDASSESHSLPA